MLRLGINTILTGLLVLFAGPLPLPAQGAQDAPDFREVYDTIRAHLAGASDAELNRAAVKGLVSSLSPRVTLVEKGAAAAAEASDVPLVSRSSVFDDGIAYLRIGRVGQGLAEAVRSACKQIAATNKLKGVVLDLRFAGGDDYPAAVAASEVFVSKERPLLNWGNGLVQSKPNNDALTVPVAALVNQRTAGAAEALAAVLRETGAGLILGSKTAGEAMMAQEFPLKNGDRLRIATAPIQLGDGTALAGGVKPDIAVEVSPAAERAYYADAFAVISPVNGALGAASTNLVSGTNGSRRLRYNEAELVRERREGFNPDFDQPTRRPEPEKPQVHDPALVRAIDLLKGLAVVRQARS